MQNIPPNQYHWRCQHHSEFLILDFDPPKNLHIGNQQRGYTMIPSQATSVLSLLGIINVEHKLQNEGGADQ